MNQDLVSALELLSALLSCSLSLSVALLTASGRQLQPAVAGELARLLSPALVLLSGLLGAKAAQLGAKASTEPSQQLLLRRVALRLGQHASALAAVVLLIVVTVTSPTAKCSGDCGPKSEANATADGQLPDCLKLEATGGTARARTAVCLVTICSLTCQIVFCWLSSRHPSSSASPDCEIAIDKEQQLQHQQQLESLKPIAGGRVGAANRKRRPPSVGAVRPSVGAEAAQQKQQQRQRPDTIQEEAGDEDAKAVEL